MDKIILYSLVKRKIKFISIILNKLHQIMIAKTVIDKHE